MPTKKFRKVFFSVAWVVSVQDKASNLLLTAEPLAKNTDITQVSQCYRGKLCSVRPRSHLGLLGLSDVICCAAITAKPHQVLGAIEPAFCDHGQI